MQRREFIGLVGGAALAWPLVARGQDRFRLIGMLSGMVEDDPVAQLRVSTFTERLRQLGWIEGKNIRIEKRFSAGNLAKLHLLARDLIDERCEILLAHAGQAVDAAREATKTVPIVMVSVGDALGSGFVVSLAHPGGNITGTTLVATDQAAKRLELLKKINPDISRIAVLSNLEASGHIFQRREMSIAAPRLGIELQHLPIQIADDLDVSLRAALDGNAQAIITMEDPIVQSLRARITNFGLKHRLPVMGEFRTMTEAGGLISYGPDVVTTWALSALYVDKILKGANPGDLPVEQPSKFELVINLKTAQGLGLTVPPTLLAQADEVIE
jgi:putative ABC transport system substrate-binding protein